MDIKIKNFLINNSYYKKISKNLKINPLIFQSKIKFKRRKINFYKIISYNNYLLYK